MLIGETIGLVLMLVSALAAILLGRNLTRSMTAALVAVVGLAISVHAAGASFVGLFAALLGCLALGTIQLFGWMLVDVDRDHLPPTDRVTWFARSLAFLLLGGGLVIFVLAAIAGGHFEFDAWSPVNSVSLETLGDLFFGRFRDVSTLAGLAIATSLLASLMLLRDEGRNE